jgi:hypothetical protein
MSSGSSSCVEDGPAIGPFSKIHIIRQKANPPTFSGKYLSLVLRGYVHLGPIPIQLDAAARRSVTLLSGVTFSSRSHQRIHSERRKRRVRTESGKQFLARITHFWVLRSSGMGVGRATVKFKARSRHANPNGCSLAADGHPATIHELAFAGVQEFLLNSIFRRRGAAR